MRFPIFVANVESGDAPNVFKAIEHTIPNPIAQRLRRRGIRPVLAKRNTEHGSGLGVFRWVVERTNSWLHQFRRLRVRFEKRPDIHEAFLTLGCILICFRFL